MSGKSSETSDVKGLADHLLLLKNRSGRSYEALARRTGISTSALHRYCSGQQVPPMYETIELFARECGADPRELAQLRGQWVRASSVPRSRRDRKSLAAAENGAMARAATTAWSAAAAQVMAVAQNDSAATMVRMPVDPATPVDTLVDTPSAASPPRGRRLMRPGVAALLGALAALVIGAGVWWVAHPDPKAGADPAVIQDTDRGTALGQVEFSAGWNMCTTTCAKAFDGSYLWTATPGATTTLRFSGRQVTLFGVKETWSNIATASIDGGVPVDVDFFASPAISTVVPVYTSPILNDGVHVLVLTMTSRRSPASAGGSAITFDRAEVVRADRHTVMPQARTTTVIEDTNTGAANGSIGYTGDSWTRCGSCDVATPDRSYFYGYTVGDAYTIQFRGRQLMVYGPTDRDGGVVDVTIDSVPSGTVDFHTEGHPINGLRWTSPVLADTDHTVTFTISATTQSRGHVALFDRAEVIAGG